MTSPGQLNHYNRTTCLSSGANDGPDVFKVAATPTLGPVPKSFVPKDFLEYKDDQGITHYTNDGSHWTEEALGPLVKIVSEVTTPKEFKAAWEVLVQYETFSTRAYLAHKTTQKPPKSTAYPQSVIEWLEMMNTGTGLYNNCLIESVRQAWCSSSDSPQAERLPCRSLTPQSSATLNQREVAVARPLRAATSRRRTGTAWTVVPIASFGP